MNSTKSLLTAAALAIASVSAMAQSANVAPANPATANTSAGLLGYRYAAAGFSYTDVNKIDRGIYAPGVSVNLPVASNLDLGFNYSHSWLEGNRKHAYSSLATVDATSYYTTGAFKPFGTLTLGYDWQKQDDRAVWGGTAGVEYDVAPNASVRVSGGYIDDFEGGEGEWRGTVGTRYWFTPTVAGSLDVSLIEGGHIGYAAGVVVKF